ncbi:MAG: hypothetical protein ACREC0_14670 [Methylocella sp.]
MGYLGTSAAALGLAMTFSFTPLGGTVRAADDKPVVMSILDRNEIVPRSASSPGSFSYSIERYGGEEKKPTLVDALADIDLLNCKETAIGAWETPDTRLCGAIKCGTVTTGTITGQLANGFCPGITYTFAAIYYEWTAHNNQSDVLAPPNSVADAFAATWTAPGEPTRTDGFVIYVPVVRPDHETTAFQSWFDPIYGVGPIGIWKQTLVGPPDTDPNFDFSGEIVQEFPAPPAGPDTCWFPKSGFKPLVAVTNQPDKPNQFATVESPGNTYPDIVGYSPMQVSCYRKNSTFLKIFKHCGTNFGQLMGIHAPSDGPPFNPPTTWTYYGKKNTGNVNLLGASMTQETVTSIRAGKPMTFPSGGVGVCPF